MLQALKEQNLILAEFLKFIGVCLSAAAAIYATRTDHIKSSKSGQLTKRGWKIIVFAIGGVIISGGAQIFQIYDVLDSAKRNEARQEKLTHRLENISYQSVRQYYPLQPISILFELEYPMDQPALSGYAKEVQSQIVSFLKKQRNGRVETRDDLSNEKVNFNITNMEEWMPKSRVPTFNLLSDNTVFDFSTPKSDSSIKLLSAKEGEQNIFVSLPTKGNPSQEIGLYADFQKRIFVKEVKSVNPLRMGKDISSISALDVIGRELSWSQSTTILPEEANAQWSLRKIGFAFSYDYQEGSASRPINNARAFVVKNNATSMKIKANHLGLNGVYEELGLDDFFEKQNSGN